MPCLESPPLSDKETELCVVHDAGIGVHRPAATLPPDLRAHPPCCHLGHVTLGHVTLSPEPSLHRCPTPRWGKQLLLRRGWSDKERDLNSFNVAVYNVNTLDIWLKFSVLNGWEPSQGRA